MKKIIQKIIHSKIGRYLITLILREFVEWLKILAREKYINQNGVNNARLDFVLMFLDSLTVNDLTVFVELPDMKAPIITIKSNPKKK